MNKEILETKCKELRGRQVIVTLENQQTHDVVETTGELVDYIYGSVCLGIVLQKPRNNGTTWAFRAIHRIHENHILGIREV